MFTLSPRLRRLIYVASFEGIAIVLASLLLGLLSDGPAHQSLPVAVIVSVIAVLWNWLYNSGFEAFERRTGRTARGFWLRVGHALGFEAGLFLVTIPMFMVWYGVGLVEAFWMEAALMLFFLAYTFLFTLGFDKLFALPNRVPNPGPKGAAQEA